jgi:hypothetical protein
MAILSLAFPVLWTFLRIPQIIQAGQIALSLYSPPFLPSFSLIVCARVSSN